MAQVSYINGLSYAKRRPATRHLSPEEAIVTANEVVDRANNQIAKMVAFAEHWQRVAAELQAENDRLAGELSEARARVAQLEKRLKTKAGKKRGWRDEANTEPANY